MNYTNGKMKKQEVNMSVWKCTNPLRSGQSQAFPQRFLLNLEKYYPTKDKKVLWMFAGGIKPSENNDTNDIRPETNATFVCDFREIPQEMNEKYDMIVADPPYNQLYADEWKTDLPKPKHIIRESHRLLKPNGLLLLFHIIITPTYRKEFGFERIGLHPVLCGLHNAIRVINILKKKSISQRCLELDYLIKKAM